MVAHPIGRVVLGVSGLGVPPHPAGDQALRRAGRRHRPDPPAAPARATDEGPASATTSNYPGQPRRPAPRARPGGRQMNPSSASSETNCARSRLDLGADRHVLESSGFGVRPDLSLVGWRTGSGCLVVWGPSPAGSARRPGSARWSARPSVSRRQVLLFHASACDGLTPPLDTGHRQGSTQAAPWLRTHPTVRRCPGAWDRPRVSMPS